MVIVAGIVGLLVAIACAYYASRLLARRLGTLETRIVKGVRQDTAQQIESLFRQLEALQGLSAELGLKKSLPPTREWAAAPDFLREIALHVLRFRPKVIVECGSGVSTLVLARCAQINGEGHVYSLEDSPEFTSKTRENLERHGCERWASVLDAPLQPVRLKGEEWPWYSFEKLPACGIDMLVVDGPPGHLRQRARYPAAPLLFGRLTAGAAVFLDDADRPDEKAIVREWMLESLNLRSEGRRAERGCVVLWNDGQTALEGRIESDA